MTQTQQLVQTLKRLLKESGKTYADVAKHLAMSEANVKRLFAKSHFSIQRIEKISNYINYTLIDLMKQMESQQQYVSSLSQSQEKTLVQDQELLLVAICALDHWRLTDITYHHHMSKTQCIHQLAQLDRLKLIELLPNNHYRLLIASDFKWIPQGPIDSFFTTHIQHEFINAPFHQAQETRRYYGGHLSQSSIEQLQRDMDAIGQTYHQLHKQDAGLPLTKKTNIGLMLAFRPWEASYFKSTKELGKN